MKLGSKDLERRLRLAAQHEMRQSQAIWNDYRRHRPNWFKRVLHADYRQGVGYLYFGFALVIAALSSGREIIVVLGVAVYAAATTIFRGIILKSETLGGYDRAVLVNLPVSDESFLDYEVRRSIWSWSRAGIIFFLAYCAALISSGHLKEQIAFAAIAAVLQAACGFCLSMLLIAFAPKTLKLGVSTPLYLMLFACLWLRGPVTQLLWQAILVTPGGWISHGFASLTGLAHGSALWLTPAFIIAACLPLAHTALRKKLLHDLNSQTLDELVPVSTFESLAEEVQKQPGQVKSASPDSDIWNGHFLEPAMWDLAGWIERFTATVLDHRQKVVAEFMLGDQLGAWSKRWRTSALLALSGIALIGALRNGPTWLFYLPLIAAAMWGAPLFGGFWWGFFGAPTSGYLTPAYAAFPVSYMEISKVIWKANAIRIIAWAPLATIHITALALKLGQSWEVGVTLSVEIILLVLAIQPAMIAGHFSVGSNDTKQLHWQSFLFFILALVLFVALILAVLLLFEADAIRGKLTGVLGMFGSPALAWFGYKLLFNRGRTDLLSKPE